MHIKKSRIISWLPSLNSSEIFQIVKNNPKMKRAYHFQEPNEISSKYREKVKNKTDPGALENASFELLNLKICQIWAKIFDLSASPNFQPFSVYFEFWKVGKTSQEQGCPFGLASNWTPILIVLDWQLVGQSSRFLRRPIGKLASNWQYVVQLAKLEIGRQLAANFQFGQSTEIEPFWKCRPLRHRVRVTSKLIFSGCLLAGRA